MQVEVPDIDKIPVCNHRQSCSPAVWREKNRENIGQHVKIWKIFAV